MDNKKTNRQTGQGLQGQGQQHNPQRKQDSPMKDKQAEMKSQKNNNMNQRSSSPGGQEQMDQSRSDNKTITNQDEQRQVTNSGDSKSPMGEEETEGDRQRSNQLSNYKNSQDNTGRTKNDSITK